MDKLLAYLNSLPPDAREQFAADCGTTVGYIRKAVSAKDRLNAVLAIRVDKLTNGLVACEDLRPDVDWAWLRNSAQRVLRPRARRPRWK